MAALTIPSPRKAQMNGGQFWVSSVINLDSWGASVAMLGLMVRAPLSIAFVERLSGVLPICGWFLVR